MRNTGAKNRNERRRRSVGPESNARRSTVMVSNRQRAKKINRPLLEHIASTVLERLKAGDWQLEIVLLGARKMAAINRRFLRHEGSTDVITFDYGAVPEPTELGNRRGRRNAGPMRRGEIFICVDEAVCQARRFQTSWQSELVRYLAHGILHLLGHDDLHPEPRREMKRREDRLLRDISRRFGLRRL
jgi:probable rRNA maturation factor